MNDQEIVQGLIARDPHVTEQFFYVKCRPLLTAILRLVFSYPVEYDEAVSELYCFLMEDDAARLRQFQYRSSVYQWLKVVATRFFIRQRNKLIENESKEPPFETDSDGKAIDTVTEINDRIDVDNLIESMSNRRYADVIRNLVLKDMEPERYADQIGVTVDNLYNIRKRAMTAITRIAINNYGYGR